MSRNFAKTALYLIMIVAMLALAGCGGTAATPAPSGDAAAPTEAAAAPSTGPQVGIVLPTKDEPRWLQDEARFKELLATANVPVEILFSRKGPIRPEIISSICPVLNNEK